MTWIMFILFWAGLALVGGMLIGSFIRVGLGRSGKDRA